ncbi:hypothetical protein MGYG_06248 [Nannizzia gypsea CBS 118893]|uniref:Uncharacterized protein n=1 Tax=Arthroderma gypseum (strain ATCC MYA-4604 / CBS 118893) TaxID=535722 RepID=E4UYR6_ARTGP|nr:hypothetical protein MGYG_06248 [Nannizzia gypsea CBS 118893]EFR03246.1 hypothetical protein MGYG_06248 [Nannizzia gypsea CBS 118893]
MEEEEEVEEEVKKQEVEAGERQTDEKHDRHRHRQTDDAASSSSTASSTASGKCKEDARHREGSVSDAAPDPSPLSPLSSLSSLSSLVRCSLPPARPGCPQEHCIKQAHPHHASDKSSSFLRV